MSARRRQVEIALVLFAAFALPLLAYAGLVAWMRATGAATVMLGASSGSPLVAVGAAVVALGLRVYTVVLMPAIAIFVIVRRVVARDRVGGSAPSAPDRT